MILSVTGVSVDITGSGDHVIVAGMPGKKILVYRLFLTCDEEVHLTIKSGSIPRTGRLFFKQNPLVLTLCDSKWANSHCAWIVCDEGDDLVFHLDDVNVIVAGQVCYDQCTC